MGKPEINVLEASGNIFAITGQASKALRRADRFEDVMEMQGRVSKAQSYDEALQIVMEYVDMF